MHARKLCAPTGQGAAEGVTGDQNLLWLERGEVHSEPAAPRATNVADPPQVSQDIEAMICWFGEKPLNPRGRFILRHTSREVQAVIKEVKYKVNINTLHKIEDDLEFRMNDIGRLSIRTSSPVIFDAYSKNRITGSFILIDAGTNETVAAGMIRG